MTDIYSPEQEIILRACRPNLFPRHAERLSELIGCSDVDWNRVVELALQHRVVPQLYRNLNSVGMQGIPAGPLQELSRNNLAIAGRSLLQTSHVIRVARLLDAAGIDALFYKGAILAALAYRGQARCFTDLDVLIRKSDRKRTLDLLVSDGFRPSEILPEAKQQIRVKYGFEDQYYSDGDRLRLEIHYDISQTRFNLGIDTEGLFARSIKQSICGVPISTLSHEYMLLFLSWHGSVNLWQPVRLIVDIAEFIDAAPDLDWTALELRSRRLDLHRVITIGLILCRDVLEADLPPEAFASFRPTRAALRVAEDFRKGIFSDLSAPSFLAGYRQEARAQLSLRSGLYTKCRTAFALALTPSERDVENNSSELTNPLISRPMRLLRKYLVRSA